MAETSGGSRPFDAQLWHVCAGALAHLPQVGSSVIYFPQGHAEQVSPPPLDLPRSAPAIACKVVCIDFLADSETDEAYTHMRLQPVCSPWHDVDADADVHVNVDAGADDVDGDGGRTASHLFSRSKPISFAKTLTQSDANNGGGFSIPRYCAETIFPRLDYTRTPPVQTVLAKDIHGAVWKFRHIYRGTPQRHLLTTGWSNFVNQKTLVAGDVIVFMRTKAGELCIGIRRAIRSAGHYRALPSRGLKVGIDQDLLISEICKSSSTLSMAVCGSTFSRHRSSVTSQSVLEAATAASTGQPFEIVYYPRATASEFCVDSHLVKRALQQSWAPGMRFKMAIETDDASRTSWYMGTILKVEEVDPIHWPKSPWKVLQVTWDEGILRGIERVNPWQVDIVSPIILPPLSLPRKKPRLLQSRGLQLDGQDDVMMPVTSALLGYSYPLDVFTASLYCSMEGARHSPNYGHAVQDFAPSNWSSAYQRPFQQLGALGIVSNVGEVLPEDSSSQNHKLTTLTTGSLSTSEPALSTNISSCDEGGSSSPKCTQFLLFGKAIDIASSVRAQPLPPLSNGSAEDGLLAQESTSDGIQSEVSFSAQGSSVETLEPLHINMHNGESLSLTSTFSNGDPESA